MGARTPAVETPAAPCRSDPAPPGPRLELSAGASAVASPTIPGSTPGSRLSGTGLTRSWPTTETTITYPGSSDQTPAKFSRIIFRGSFSTYLGSHLYGPSNKHYNCIIQFSFYQHFVTKLTINSKNYVFVIIITV